ncbi:glycosyltransferase family 2 protein [Thermophagus xiamenensis]|uniref:Glycosyltransferase involved in cell wall bisynthesis n=1 Tax=Thermophagus xiamenensis TaxID=385682 RepID=A0A1I2DMW7_9BACT|nr:glycosyltransferase family 2 protein [Thermophagus xiamenensis]SFE81808.1 Glycosyltransferase involved in cell wall bisynthesis [Thermophagus xiamenensis]
MGSRKNKVVVSVITVVFNEYSSIETTLKSVIGQSFDNFEYICIDGGSNDGTLELLEKYKKYFSEFISEPDAGVYDAMNKGLNYARGEWVIFINSGDQFCDKYVLENVFKSKIYCEDSAVIYGDTILDSSVGAIYSKSDRPFFQMDSFIKSKGICHQSVFVRRDVALKYKFNHNLKISADFKMLYDIYQAGYHFQYLEMPISMYKIDDGISKKNQIQAWKEDAIVIGIDNTMQFKIWFFFARCFFFLKKYFSKYFRNFFPNFFLVIKRYRLNK